MKVLCKDDPKKLDTAHGKQLGCKDAMRSTLARTYHDPWQLNHAIGRPGPSEDVSNRGDRATVLVEDMWCEEICGCSYRRRDAPYSMSAMFR